MNERLIYEHSLVLKYIKPSSPNLSGYHVFPPIWTISSIDTKQTKSCAHSDYVQGCLNLLYRRLLLCETAVLYFSENVHSLHIAVTTNLILLKNSSYNSIIGQSTLIIDNQHSDLEPDSSSSDECDSDNSLVS